MADQNEKPNDATPVASDALLAAWRAAPVTVENTGSDSCRFCDEYSFRLIRHGICDACWMRIANVIEEEIEFQSANSQEQPST